MTPLIGVGLKIAGQLIDRAFPDKAKAQELQHEITKMALTGELDDLARQHEAQLAQIAVNEAEAKHPDIFVSGWRPFIGWVCAGGFAWVYIGRDFTILAAKILGSEIDATALPNPDVFELMPLLFGMLGLSYNRTQEKKAGVARSQI